MLGKFLDVRRPRSIKARAALKIITGGLMATWLLAAYLNARFELTPTRRAPPSRAATRSHHNTWCTQHRTPLVVEVLWCKCCVQHAEPDRVGGVCVLQAAPGLRRRF